MRRIFLKINQSKDPDGVIAGRIKRYLAGRDVLVSDVSALGDADTKELEDSFLIVLGGDGTMLEAAHDVFRHRLPIVGVNLGTVGYLTEIEKDHIEESLERLLSGDYTIEERMMLKGELSDGFSYAALNDIVIARYGPIRVNRYAVSVNDLLLNTYHGDGIILATPTGSTGYNLSAGGPIVDPKASMTLMTPISPTALSSRSIVLSSDDVVSVFIEKAAGDEGDEVAVSFDGIVSRTIKTGEKLTVRRSKHVTKMMRIEPLSFMEVLHRKFRK